MFGAPPILKTEVFAAIPTEFRQAGKMSEERLRAGKGSLKTDSYIEGPAFDVLGNLYIVDIAFGSIYQISPAGVVKKISEYDGEPNGLKIYPDGRIIVTDHRHGLMQCDPQTGEMTSIARRFRTESFKGLNDLVFSKEGDIYFTDQGQTGLQDPSGRVFRLNQDGVMECLLNNVPSPNGIALDHQEHFLYIAATRSNSIWRAMILPDRSLTRVGNFIQMSGGAGPDGLAVDRAGNLYVAHAGMGAVWKFSPRGEPLLRIVSCMGAMTTNIAFGGKDQQHLYITESETGSVLIAHLDHIV